MPSGAQHAACRRDATRLSRERIADAGRGGLAPPRRRRQAPTHCTAAPALPLAALHAARARCMGLGTDVHAAWATAPPPTRGCRRHPPLTKAFGRSEPHPSPLTMSLSSRRSGLPSLSAGTAVALFARLQCSTGAAGGLRWVRCWCSCQAAAAQLLAVLGLAAVRLPSRRTRRAHRLTGVPLGPHRPSLPPCCRR